MSGPPDNVTANALFDALCAMPRPFRVVDIPRKAPDGSFPLQCHLQVLTQQERMVAVAAAEKFAQRALRAQRKDEESFLPKKDAHSQGYDDLYTNELSVQLLFRACKQVEKPRLPFFPTADDLRKVLDGDEIGVLTSAYHIVQAEVGPIVTTMDDGELNEWIDMLAEGASAVPLGRLSSGALRDLVMHLVSRLSKSSTVTGSSGEAASSGLNESVVTDDAAPIDVPDGDDLSTLSE